MDDAMRHDLRVRGVEAIKVAQTLEASARALVQTGISNEAEFQRLFGA